jgi:glucose/arabinose dehydrogenase
MKRLTLFAGMVCSLVLLQPDAGTCYDLAAWLRARVAPASVPVVRSSQGKYKAEVVLEGLESPWAIVPAPDGRLFITERPGRLRIVQNGRMRSAPVPGVPRVSDQGQGGLLDMALHPGFATNRLIYLAYTMDSDAGLMTRIARFRETPDGLKEMKLIFPGFAGSDKPKHFGSRMVFGRDGKLYFTLGERGEGERAQDLMDLNGKTLRLNEDGTLPSDNPFIGHQNARPEIFSYGNRNAQGMAVQPRTGHIFQTEHGPSWNDAPGGGDEVNIIIAGGNYGWPVIHHREGREGMISPLLEYTPAIAPAGAMFYTGDLFPQWENDFFFATLVGQKIVRVKFKNLEPLEQEFLIEEQFGRLRAVAQGVDGSIFVVTSDTDAYGPGRRQGDRLIRLLPST